jgi:hypothetical protein
MSQSSTRGRPIIFSGAMVRALLQGRKTMTRRLALTSRRQHCESTPTTYHSTIKIMASPWQNVKPGDRIWVRENLKNKESYIHYAADEKGIGWEIERGGSRGRTWPPTWLQDPRPSIHMPRAASRLTLVVTEVKVERLQSITAVDAEREGVPTHVVEHTFRKVYRDEAERAARRIEYFAELWEKLHGEDAWDANPEVVALSFDVIKSNIDRLPV